MQVEEIKFDAYTSKYIGNGNFGQNLFVTNMAGKLVGGFNSCKELALREFFRAKRTHKDARMMIANNADILKLDLKWEILEEIMKSISEGLGVNPPVFKQSKEFPNVIAIDSGDWDQNPFMLGTLLYFCRMMLIFDKKLDHPSGYIRKIRSVARENDGYFDKLAQKGSKVVEDGYMQDTPIAENAGNIDEILRTLKFLKKHRSEIMKTGSSLMIRTASTIGPIEFGLWLDDPNGYEGYNGDEHDTLRKGIRKSFLNKYEEGEIPNINKEKVKYDCSWV